MGFWQLNARDSLHSLVEQHLGPVLMLLPLPHPTPHLLLPLRVTQGRISEGSGRGCPIQVLSGGYCLVSLIIVRRRETYLIFPRVSGDASYLDFM